MRSGDLAQTIDAIVRADSFELLAGPDGGLGVSFSLDLRSFEGFGFLGLARGLFRGELLALTLGVGFDLGVLLGLGDQRGGDRRALELQTSGDGGGANLLAGVGVDDMDRGSDARDLAPVEVGYAVLEIGTLAENTSVILPAGSDDANLHVLILREKRKGR
jgi:hypothetical protein